MQIYLDHLLLQSISKIMIKKGLTLSVAESCTGGFISTFFTSQSGASNFFKGSLITYSNEAKVNLLGIDPNIINDHGVVSKMVVDEMADSVRKKHGVDYGLATTGYVECFDTNTAPANITLHAWISISSANNTISELVPLNQSRLENISHVSYRLLNLFRKEIL